jgi:hypothetical protein
MEPDKHIHTIERLLQQIPELERNLDRAEREEERIRIERSLKHRRKRFEHLIPFRFRLELRRLCQQAGVQGDFL